MKPPRRPGMSPAITAVKNGWAATVTRVIAWYTICY